MRCTLDQRIPSQLQESSILLGRRERKESRHRRGLRVCDRDGLVGHGPEIVVDARRRQLRLALQLLRHLERCPTSPQLQVHAQLFTGTDLLIVYLVIHKIRCEEQNFVFSRARGTRLQGLERRLTGP